MTDPIASRQRAWVIESEPRDGLSRKLNHGRIELTAAGCMNPGRGLTNLSSTKLHCPHCHTEATEIKACLSQDSVTYCKNCGWNIKKATTMLRDDLQTMWISVGVGGLFAAAIWMRGGSEALAGVIGIAIAAVALPLVLVLFTKRRLSRLAALQPRTPQQIVHAVAPALTISAAADQERDAFLAMRPRMVRLTRRGYSFVAGIALLTPFVAWLLSVAVRGIAGQWNIAIVKYVLALLLWSSVLWRCVSFFRNRIRERRLLVNGELSHGLVLKQSKTTYGSQIVYRYRDLSGKLFQNCATDFSNTLYEDMPLHVFYDQLDSCESAALESSLYRVG